MKMLDNIPVTTSSGLTSTVPETPPAAWAGGTTYALGATVSVVVASGVDTGWTGAGQLDVYQGLQASNTNHAPASSPTWWKKIGTVYQEYAAGTTYALGDRAQITGSHLVYQSSAASNVGNPPATTPAKWDLVGATNRWAMFDEKVGTQTQAPDQIKVSFVVPGRAGALALLNVDAASIRYRQIAPDTTVLVDRTLGMTSTDGIVDWFAYFTNDVIRKTDLAIEDMTYVAGCTVEVTVSSPGGVARIGVVAPGQFKLLGGTLYGVQLAFTDYSKFTEDAWGNFDIQERAYRKRVTSDVKVAANFVDEFQRLMASRRARFTVFWGADDYSSTLIYGFPKLGNTVISFIDYSTATLTLEGLAQQ